MNANTIVNAIANKQYNAAEEALAKVSEVLKQKMSVDFLQLEKRKSQQGRHLVITSVKTDEKKKSL